MSMSTKSPVPAGSLPIAATQANPSTAVGDAASEDVVAIYLRPASARSSQSRAPETLVDSITRIVCEMLEVHVRESVTAAVRALAPRLQVSFPPSPGATALPAPASATPPASVPPQLE